MINNCGSNNINFKEVRRDFRFSDADKLNLQKIIWAMILIPGALAMYGAWKGSKAHQG